MFINYTVYILLTVAMAILFHIGGKRLPSPPPKALLPPQLCLPSQFSHLIQASQM